MLVYAITAIIFIIASIVLCIVEGNVEAENKRACSWQESNDMQPAEIDEKVRKETKSEMRKIRIIVYGVLTGIFALLALVNAIFFTNEQQTAFTMRFGNPVMVENAGIHFKIPFVTRVYKYDATTKGMAIGYDPETDESKLEESLMITSDFNFVNTDFHIDYRISDPIEYEFGSNNPEGILRNMAQSSIRNTVGQYGVDAVITTGKGEIEAVVKNDIIEKLQQHSTGLSIVNVTIQDAEPPTKEVAKAFNDVENAKQDADTAINNAKKSEKEKIPNAEAEADKIIKTAQAVKMERINQANQEVAEFNALFKEFMQNPETVKKQLYYSTMKEILPNMEIIIGSDSKVVYVKNDGQVTSTSGN